MTSLDNIIGHLKEEIEVADRPIGNQYQAYRMDCVNKPDRPKKDGISKIVGMPSCHCCDYFLPGKNAILLIEETRLSCTVDTRRKQFAYLSEAHKGEIINRIILDEMRLKAYGALLVLCRFLAIHPAMKDTFRDKKYNLWIVASKTEVASEVESEEEIIFGSYLDSSLLDDLNGSIKGALGKDLLNNVEVFSSEILKQKFSDK